MFPEHGIALAALLLLSCSPAPGGDDAAGMGRPSDLPPSCPADAPHYQATIAPLFQRLCVPCHVQGGSAPDRPLSTYQQVYNQHGVVLDVIYDCNMPPQGTLQPTLAEREALLAWLVCKAPDN